jgi:Uma2 family endonuclease
VEDAGIGKLRPGINLPIDPDDWEHDYRVPDVAVFLVDSPANCYGTYWSGPPDFLVESISPFDKTREKLGFYSKIGARELLLVDRDPWQLERQRLPGKVRKPDAKISLGDTKEIASEVLPLGFRLVPASPRPTIEIIATQLSRSRTV